MTVVTDLVTALEADAGLSALVGARVYPLLAPNDATYPLVVYQVVSEVPVGSGSPRCEDVRVQLSAYGTSYASMAAVKNALKNFAVTNGYRYVVAGDMVEFEGDENFFHQPVDIFIL